MTAHRPFTVRGGASIPEDRDREEMHFLTRRASERTRRGDRRPLPRCDLPRRVRRPARRRTLGTAARTCERPRRNRRGRRVDERGGRTGTPARPRPASAARSRSRGSSPRCSASTSAATPRPTGTCSPRPKVARSHHHNFRAATTSPLRRPARHSEEGVRAATRRPLPRPATHLRGVAHRARAQPPRGEGTTSDTRRSASRPTGTGTCSRRHARLADALDARLQTSSRGLIAACSEIAMLREREQRPRRAADLRTRLERTTGFEPATLNLGKVVLYQLSHVRVRRQVYKRPRTIGETAGSLGAGQRGPHAIGIFGGDTAGRTIDDVVARRASGRSRTASRATRSRRSSGSTRWACSRSSAARSRASSSRTGVVPTYGRHPLTMAQQALTVQAASGGRFTLGIGLSHQMVIESMFGLSFDKPVRHMREYLVGAHAAAARRQRATFDGRDDLHATRRVDVADAHAAAGARRRARPKMLELAGTRHRRHRHLDDRARDARVAHRARRSPPPAEARAGRRRASSRRCRSASPTTSTPRASAAAQDFQVYGFLPSYRAMLDREGAEGPADVAIVGDEATVEKRAAAGSPTRASPSSSRRSSDRATSAPQTRALLKSML